MTLISSEGIGAELGLANGDFTTEPLAINRPKKLHLIDVWKSELYNEKLFNNVKRKFETGLDRGEIIIHRILSTNAAQFFNNNYPDWIYIDTCHSYEGTKEELAAYASKIKKNGIISGHDDTMGNWKRQLRYGVMEAVHEFCVNEG